MLLHNLRIALKSLRRNSVLSMLLVTGIALGIAVATTFAAVRHSYVRDPVPSRSAGLRYVQLDSWDPARPYPAQGADPMPTQITYRDAVELLKSKVPARQAAMFKTGLYVYPDPKGGDRPFQEIVRVVSPDFFRMFDVPFRWGGAWDAKADEKGEPVAVLSTAMNERLFGGRNSVGKTFRMGDRDFKVAGVTDRWLPSVKFYDMTQNVAAPPEEIIVPFGLVRPMQLGSFGNNDGWGPSPSIPGFEGRLVSESCWIQYWVELPDAHAVAAYRDYLSGYIAEQKKQGRFPRPPLHRLSTIGELMDLMRVVPREVNALLWVSLLFLAVCALNLVGLLLGKFLSRAPEVGVRRALGASRLDIFLQHVVECELIGVMGGAVGLLLSAATLAFLNELSKATITRSGFFALDLPMVALSVGLALLAGLIAGVYPAWRTCQLAPAVHLKLQ
jgi:putative ABC transport system permease protein